MTLLMNLIFAQPCWQLSCLSGWEEQVFAELELGALASLIISQLAFLILRRRLPHDRGAPADLPSLQAVVIGMPAKCGTPRTARDNRCQSKGYS